MEAETEPCEICHDGAQTSTWRGVKVCEDCATNGRYHDSLTTAELRAEEESIAEYCDLSREV